MTRGRLRAGEGTQAWREGRRANARAGSTPGVPGEGAVVTLSFPHRPAYLSRLMTEPSAAAAVAAHVPVSARGGADASVRSVFAVEALTSVGSTLLGVGIFFYTQHRFAWGLRENFLLAATQGVAYV